MKSTLTENNTTKIQTLIDQFLSTWNTKNLDAFTNLFTEDAEFTDVVGQIALGKEAIKKQHEFAFNVVMKNANLTLHNVYMRQVMSNLVMVTANWLNVGSQTPQGKVLPNRNGVLQFLIIENEVGEWMFKLVHNADFALAYQKRDGFIQE